jgi:Holliday junction resolvasome RuvABC ATP-dependent DNA helicase subunit
MKSGKLTEEDIEKIVEKATLTNQIEIGGVVVASQKSSLKEVEATANRLLKKHKDFLLMKKEIKIKSGGID